MTPYHLFVQSGKHFVYHLTAGRFIQISPAAYELLELRTHLSKDAAEAEFRKRHGDAEAEGVLADVRALEADGFFEPAEPPLLDDDAFERELEERLSGPRNGLMLSVASGCNLACKYCYCGVCRDKLPNKGLMSVETALRAVEKLFTAADPKQSVRITFFGGEPLLNKPVIARVVARCNALAAERGTKAGFSITTNGTLLDDDTVEMLNGDFGLMVSLDGPKELHDRQCPTRDGEGSFDRATEGIRRLMKKRGRVTVRCTMAHPAPDAMKLIRFFADFGFSRIVLGTVRNPAFPSACDFTEEDNRTFDRAMETEILPWMLAEKAAGREPIYNPFDEIADFQGEKEHPEKVRGLRCGACHSAMAVAPDGTLYPCHRFVGMEAWTIGTLESGPDPERCKRFWRRHRECMKARCGTCWAYRVCGGPCPWEIARADGTFALSDFLCKETCNWIRHGIYYLSQSKTIGSETGVKTQ